MICEYCDEPVLAGERADVEPAVLHRECAFRAVSGSAGHILKECSCYGGVHEDPPGMSKREAARLALEAWRAIYMAEG